MQNGTLRQHLRHGHYDQLLQSPQLCARRGWNVHMTHQSTLPFD